MLHNPCQFDIDLEHQSLLPIFISTQTLPSENGHLNTAPCNASLLTSLSLSLLSGIYDYRVFFHWLEFLTVRRILSITRILPTIPPWMGSTLLIEYRSKINALFVNLNKLSVQQKDWIHFFSQSLNVAHLELRLLSSRTIQTASLCASSHSLLLPSGGGRPRV